MMLRVTGYHDRVEDVNAGWWLVVREKSKIYRSNYLPIYYSRNLTHDITLGVVGSGCMRLWLFVKLGVEGIKLRKWSSRF